MINLLAQKINMPVSVATQAIDSEKGLVPCTLLGVENEGLWLSGTELLEHLPGDLPARGISRVFIPFAQVVFLTDAPPDHPQSVPPEPVKPIKPHKSRK